MKKSRIIKNISLIVVLLGVAILISLYLKLKFNVERPISAIFVFAVFLVAMFTDSIIYGLIATAFAELAVNYVFVYPYLALDFSLTENVVSALIKIIIAIITSTMTMQLKRQNTIKAEGEKERMRANLLRAISHDLRTPLTTIYSSASTLMEKKEVLTSEQQERILEGIKEDSEWLVTMVENLLSITKIDSGQVKIKMTPTVLDELIDSVLVKFKKRYPEQEIKLEMPEDILVVPMDAMLMEQVLINILDNAVQHAEGMTELSMKMYARDKIVRFRIQDNGCGIKQERLNKIFTGYHNSEGLPADSRKKNTGIGLSVCSTIVKAHGGNITAENVKGGGAVFEVSLNM